jgi:hypothetical protein
MLRSEGPVLQKEIVLRLSTRSSRCPQICRANYLRSSASHLAEETGPLRLRRSGRSMLLRRSLSRSICSGGPGLLRLGSWSSSGSHSRASGGRAASGSLTRHLDQGCDGVCVLGRRGEDSEVLVVGRGNENRKGSSASAS